MQSSERGWRWSLAPDIPLAPLPDGYLFKLPAAITAAQLKRVLKGELAVTATDESGAVRYKTGVQLAKVLDELYRYDGPLGATFDDHGGITIRVWAPTAQEVNLQLFENENDDTATMVLPMTEDDGVWVAFVETGRYYLFEVLVYVPALEQIVRNIVTDPYSVDLALNGSKTRLTNLADPAHKPPGWDAHTAPPLDSVNDLTIYELHVRDFSCKDASVPERLRGTYLAFTDPTTNGMRHLADLAQSGMKAIHLLPTFHFASINEDKSTWKTSGDLTGLPPDSEAQQAAVAEIQNADGYNWGYDPVHYSAPTGAYALNPKDRVKEYRQMVKALHQTGLRIFQDVVFNHTSSSGQSADSVLDKIVPGYYYRLDANGDVLNSTCCSNTASEHRMMEKLMIDTLVTQARHYKIDGFRFDLMGFHFTYNMERIQAALAAEGLEIYLYGEGWETGETANNALGPNASQRNLFGTGIGTFNDRFRDGIRGGGPFSDHRLQGFATGLDAAADDLLEKADLIRAGLAGNLRDYQFASHTGETVACRQLNYAGQGVGYTANPAENILYASCHDNLTLFDAIQIKSRSEATLAERVRRQIVANSLVALGQGIPFFQAGDDLLRSKDIDNNSYNSGDWFNGIDFTFQTNNWGIGLPIASENQAYWPIIQPLLANPALRATPVDVDLTRRVFQEFLRIRASSSLFRLRTAAEVHAKLAFVNTGPAQIPGVIGMSLNNAEIVVVFNAATSPARLQADSLKGLSLKLHPTQMKSADEIVRNSTLDSATGTVIVPALTTAVFVASEAAGLL